MMCNDGSKLKRYVLTNIKGNEVMAAIYGDEVDILCPMIKLFAVYDISNADVKTIDRKFRIIENPFQWNIKRQTLIKPVPESMPMLTFFLDSLTPFSKIRNANNLGISSADIMGIIIDAGEAKSVNRGRNNIQHFTIIDTEKIPLCISIWDEMIETEGRALVEAAENHSVIVAKRLAVKTYNFISLASKNSTSFAIDPPIQVVSNMISWFMTIPESELDELKARKTSTFTRDLVTAGKMRTYTISEVVTNAPAGDYWVRASLHLIDDGQKLYYVACSNCHTKVKSDIGHHYTCFLCKKNVVACLRLLVIMLVADQTDKVEVVAVEEAAEQILQTIVEDMIKLHNSGQQMELDSIKEGFDGKTFLMLLHRTAGTKSESQRRLLLISYHEQCETIVQSLPSVSSETLTITYPTVGSSNLKGKGEVSLSPLKRQMSEVAINSGNPSEKQLIMDQANEEGETSDAPKHSKKTSNANTASSAT